MIYHNFKELLENQDAYNVMAKVNNPYGDGKACFGKGIYRNIENNQNKQHRKEKSVHVVYV